MWLMIKIFFQHRYYFLLLSVFVIFFSLLIISLSLSLAFSFIHPLIEIISQNSIISPNCVNLLHNNYFLSFSHHLIYWSVRLILEIPNFLNYISIELQYDWISPLPLSILSFFAFLASILPLLKTKNRAQGPVH